MKKILLALMAVAAIALTGCIKHETASVYVVNNYSKSALVLFSHDKDCRSIEAADFFAYVKPQESRVAKGVKLNGMYAIVFECFDEKQVSEGSTEGFKHQVDFNLNEYAGMASLTVEIKSDGYPSVNASSL